MKLIQQIFDSKGGPILIAVFALLLIAERRRRLRKRTQPAADRVIINTAVSAPSFALLRFLFLPLMVMLAQKNQEYKFGLNYFADAPPAIMAVISFLILDYGNYLWHVLNHKIPFLWRFHLVHHTDLDLDVTTAFRFHFGELIGSVFFRGLFVLLSGATGNEVLVYEIFFEGATQFHHSNWRLPAGLDKKLNKLIVTPVMHGIHHSVVRAERDSNYSVIFSFWDRLHATLNYRDNNDKITIGVPSYQDKDELTPGQLLSMPFKKIRSQEAS